MLLRFNNLNLNIIDISYKKIKINYYFLNYKYIIFLKINDVYNFKNKLLNYNIFSFSLKNNYIKSLFNLPSFFFLRGGSSLCIFINDTISFINIIKILENKQFFYAYKYSLSNIYMHINILKNYEKYNMNYIFIQFILKKIKIKIIILLFLFLILLIKYIK